MMKWTSGLFMAALLATSCHRGAKVPAPSADSAFASLSREFIKGYLDWRPQAGVALGYHQYDTMVPDFGNGPMLNEIVRLRVYDSLLSDIDTGALSPRNYRDYRILHLGIQQELFNIVDLNAYTRNPITYAQAVDLNTYVKRDFAPLEYRLGCIIKVERQLPFLFEQAKRNLEATLPKPLIDMAIEVAKGSEDFLKRDLPVALKDVKSDALMHVFAESNAEAIKAIDGYIQFLAKHPADDHFALGEENYRKMLHNVELIDLSPDSLLAIGMRELKREQGVFQQAAHIINPNKPAVEVYKDMEKEHPSADSLIPDTRKHLEGIRQFLIDHKICSLPSDVRIQVKETPPYARSTSTASCDVPGPFETKATEAYYYVTPVDARWTPQQKEDWLAMFNYYTTDVVTIHEAYPGHYVQFTHLKASDGSDVEKIFASYAYVEGWAHYTERMMLDEGYGNNGDPVTAAKYRLAQSGDALLRICRLCNSIMLHTKGISVDSATHFFMANWYQGEKPSNLEALRGTFDPGYLFYTVGKLEILKLRADYQQQEGAGYSLKTFNDAMMDNGQPPIRLLREVLLKDKTKWGEVL
ncbi:DUF885 domain-containing protein [Dinghuibacter silviterrae]|uniref:Uncharacterized protein (DUF885 family) n=1 Tax=Dinghuibacter silviterrae TaxID=1539049 RepID=A0A4R8DJ39_9BACT|nr:DUF885 domain-containing protein [Dinghuibacter silviterrae]TDW97577.1 uncharacterized protein (DUF885 family) [Dinghuibacter silviterrae]